MSERFLIPGHTEEIEYSKEPPEQRMRKLEPRSVSCHFMQTTVLMIAKSVDGELYANHITHCARMLTAFSAALSTNTPLEIFESQSPLLGWNNMSKGRIPITKVDDPEGDEDDAIIYATGKDGDLYSLEIDCDDALNIALDIAKSVSIIGSIDPKAGWEKL